MTTRVLLADDHPMFREGLRAMLDGRPAFAVVAVAASGEQAVAAAERERPDVAVLELRMPGGDGVAATAGIRRVSPDTRVLVLTSFDGDREVADALAAGAHGYLLKSAAPSEIADAVAAVASGASVLSDTVLATIARRSAVPRSRPFPQLTDREFDVLEALAHGLDTEATARRLGLSGKTVRNNLSSVLAKLCARDRAAAVVLAHQAGVGPG
ncbi:two component transcriptional regulator, LuxR family [Geodermatophilus saharensis]|uniref:Two component transcriptional regulator, LuxR family n=1 Tax=Geodermatophilus saharensis TaxID=1137994 RepID=A0A239BTJ6_9ACTN|nr:response regulator transcription factor [Geodermatophilus saharensis]SNS10738.1 two component transcriptional regulator, LuxR family [Geodermatophilus saharensis]